MRRCLICILLTMLTPHLCSAAKPALTIHGNRVSIHGRRGQILYRGTGDLYGDHRTETAFAMLPYDKPYTVIAVGRRTAHGWQLIATHEVGYYSLRTDVTDVNGDGKAEIIARGISGDGHGWCDIYTLRKNALVRLGSFSDTQLRDLSGDGIPEVLSTGFVSVSFLGDLWLTIYKWSGQGYTDVSRRFPREYDRVVRNLKQTIHDLRFTHVYGMELEPNESPDIFADLYYCLGKAYEYRGFPAKAKVQYAVAHRLNPDRKWTFAPIKVGP